MRVCRRVKRRDESRSPSWLRFVWCLVLLLPAACAPVRSPNASSRGVPPRELSEAEWLRLGDRAIAAEGAAGAVRVFQEAVRSDSSSFALRMSLGVVYEGTITQVRHRRGEWIPVCPTSTSKRDAGRAALAQYARAESLLPASPDPLVNRANLFHVWGLVEEALGEYEVANRRRRLSDDAGNRALGIVMVQMGLADSGYQRPGGRGFVVSFPEPRLMEVRGADRGPISEPPR